MLPNTPKAARISEQLADLDHGMGPLTVRSYGSDELLFRLVARIPRESGMSVRQRRSARQGPSAMKICLCIHWSWLRKRRVTSTSMPTPLGVATLATIAVVTMDLHPRDKGKLLRMLATIAMSKTCSGVTPETRRMAWCMPLTATGASAFWCEANSRRPTLMARPRCLTTRGVLSPVPSVVGASTTGTSATTISACLLS